MLPRFPACDFPAWRPPVRWPLTVLPVHDCPYLPGRPAQSRAFHTDQLSAALYRQLMDAGFRRSGKIVYQPICSGCRRCLPLRVPVERFTPSKSQRRCQRRNADLHIALGAPQPTAEKFELYRRYQTQWHRTQLTPDWEEFASFLYDSPILSLEFTYRDVTGQLLAVGLCDLADEALSSVYFYFDPIHARRRLGIFGVLSELDACHRLGLPYYYLGYWVRGCPAMEYKADFRPCQILHPDGVWHEDAAPQAISSLP